MYRYVVANLFFIAFFLLLLAHQGVARSSAPSCVDAGQQRLCSLPCSSQCRGFAPGFASPGCIDETDCSNTPSWASGSVCECDSSPSPSPTPPSPTPPSPTPTDGMVGGYVLLNDGGKKLQLLASKAKSGGLPLTRVWLAFVSPTMTYVPGSKTLEGTGLDDLSFTKTAQAVADLEASGVEVFLSMGGWNYNCYPYMYARYSVAGYGQHTPNYWKIKKYGQGDIDNCDASNMFCYTCEPPSENSTLSDFSIFPEPSGSESWEAAKKYVESNAGSPTPEWHEMIVPGSHYTDPNTDIASIVPGMSAFAKLGRNPYEDVVHLAKDLNVSGIDLDYEEFWHADYFKTGTGPWELHQTVYKYTAVAKNLLINIESVHPSLKLSTTASAVGAWTGTWWGGNLKGAWSQVDEQFPAVSKSLDICVMTYDLSKNQAFHECPDDQDCALDKQVSFYMATYRKSNIPASVGFEIGTPAYPDKDEDAQDQLPLTTVMLSSILENTAAGLRGGFLWELFKGTASDDQATPTEVAQAVCRAFRAGDPRCDEDLPELE